MIRRSLEDALSASATMLEGLEREMVRECLSNALLWLKRHERKVKDRAGNLRGRSSVDNGEGEQAV